jgi:hypothetical protein
MIINNKLKYDKKGMIEIQFHWIFLMVAGMLLFLFIVSMIFVQKNRSETIVSVEVMRQITTSFKSKQQISDSFSPLEVPNTKFYFDCDKDILDFRYKLEGSQWEVLPIEIMFASKELTGRKIWIWTQDFQAPFTVTRFVYLTTPDTAFIIYNNTGDPDAKMIYDNLPPNITKFYASSSTYNDILSQYKKYKLICFGVNCGPADNRIDRIRIVKDSNSLYSYGNVNYLKNGIGSLSYNYMTKASLFGAIFSDNGDFYDCQMNRAFKQFELKRGLHYARVQLLENVLLTENPGCIPVLAAPKSALILMENKTHNNPDLVTWAKKLESGNYDLDVKSCPLIY